MIYKTNFKTAIKWLHNNFVMCNEVCNVDENLLDNGIISSTFNCDDEDEDIGEVMQLVLTDCSESDVNFLCKHFTGLHFAYSDVLGLYVLLITHYGTSWDYVYSETDIPSAERNLGE